MAQSQYFPLEWAPSAYAEMLPLVVSDPRLPAVREAALKSIVATGLPTTRAEDWKYTNLSEIGSTRWRAVTDFQFDPKRHQVPESLLLANRSGLAVFINGHFVAPLSELGDVEVADLCSAPAPSFVSRIGGQARSAENVFAAMNTAFFTKPVRVAVTGIEERPFQILHLVDSGFAGAMSSPRLSIEVSKNSGCAVVETFAQLNAPTLQYFTNSVVEISVAEGAWCEHTKIQLESVNAFHVGSLWVTQHDSSKFTSNVFHFGGKTVRNEIYPTIDGSEAECFLNGLTAVCGEQHVDNLTVIDHAKPNSFSREIYKGVYDDRSAGVFSGTIIVRQDAQKTNAIQSNQSVLLTDTATIDSRPQLKIWADDVKCTHGATVGQLDTHALFYLRSRGIGEEQAKRLLLHAFASEVIYHLGSQESRALLENALNEKLGGALE